MGRRIRRCRRGAHRRRDGRCCDTWNGNASIGAARSAVIVRDCIVRLSTAGFQGVLLIASNPVDLMTMVAFDFAGLPASRVIGTGTLLDSSRLRASLAARLDVAPSTVDALVLGEHGDSEVALFSAVRIGGMALADFSPDAHELDRSEMACAVRDAGYDIIGGKGTRRSVSQRRSCGFAKRSCGTKAQYCRCRRVWMVRRDCRA